MPLELAATIPTGIPGVFMTFLHGGPMIQRTIVPAGVAFSVPSHYHLSHDEYFSVAKGEIELTCDGVTSTVSHADGELKIPRDLLQEPRDNEKERFFRNMFYGAETGVKPLQALVAMYEADGWPSLPGKIRWLENLFVTIVGGYVGPTLGYNKFVTMEDVDAWHAKLAAGGEGA
ncbi:hypothetical protein RQP46_011129 [Phenoliferia psychrophenolica]